MNSTMDTLATARTLANTSTQSNVPSANSAGKTYYMKYIHNENLERLQAAQKIKDKFIPKSKTENKTYHQKFNHYMKQLDHDEKIQLKEEKRQREARKEDLARRVAEDNNNNILEVEELDCGENDDP